MQVEKQIEKRKIQISKNENTSISLNQHPRR